MNIQQAKQTIKIYKASFDKHDTNTQFYDACQIAEEAIYKYENSLKLSQSIARAFSLGCRIELSRDMGMCYIQVKHDISINWRDQYLPIDGHLNYALPGAIDFCVNSLLEPTNEH